jgi:hypothetical protein
MRGRLVACDVSQEGYGGSPRLGLEELLARLCLFKCMEWRASEVPDEILIADPWPSAAPLLKQI